MMNGLNFDSNTLVIDPQSNNIGIGTASPSYPLEIDNNSQAVAALSTHSNTATNRSILVFQKSRGTAASKTNVQNGDTLGSFQANAYSGSSYYGVAGLKFEVDGTFTSGQRPPSRIIFETTVSNGAVTERMRIDKDGNVGIGTTDPDNILHLERASTDLYALLRSSTLNVDAFMASIWDNPSSDPSYTQGAHVFYGSGSNHPVAFRTNNTEKMTITTAATSASGSPPQPANLK